MEQLVVVRQRRPSLDRQQIQRGRCGGVVQFQGVENRFGWTAGVGVEWALWQNWSVKLEYDYYGFGTRNVTFVDNTISGVTGPVSITQNLQTVKLGVNFHVSPGGW